MLKDYKYSNEEKQKYIKLIDDNFDVIRNIIINFDYNTAKSNIYNCLMPYSSDKKFISFILKESKSISEGITNPRYDSLYETELITIKLSILSNLPEDVRNDIEFLCDIYNYVGKNEAVYNVKSPNGYSNMNAFNFVTASAIQFFNKDLLNDIDVVLCILNNDYTGTSMEYILEHGKYNDLLIKYPAYFASKLTKIVRYDEDDTEALFDKKFEFRGNFFPLSIVLSSAIQDMFDELNQKEKYFDLEYSKQIKEEAEKIK